MRATQTVPNTTHEGHHHMNAYQMQQMIDYYRNITQEQVNKDMITLLFIVGIAISIATVWGLALLVEYILIG